MEWQIGEILEGKVTGITKFGAFVALPGGKSGLVHISEVANAFVSDVNEHVKVGETVKVMLLSVTPEGKINLSMKRAAEPQRSQAPRPEARRRPEQPAQSQPRAPRVPTPPPAESSGNQDFEDRLKKFMQESDSRIAGSRIYAEHKQRRRGR